MAYLEIIRQLNLHIMELDEKQRTIEESIENGTRNKKKIEEIIPLLGNMDLLTETEKMEELLENLKILEIHVDEQTIRDSISLKDYFSNENFNKIEQIITAKNNIDNLSRKLKEAKELYDVEIASLQNSNNNNKGKKEICEKYLGLFNDNGEIVNYPSPIELREFFEFLSQMNIDRRVLNDFIKDFGIKCLNYYQNNKPKEISSSSFKGEKQEDNDRAPLEDTSKLVQEEQKKDVSSETEEPSFLISKDDLEGIKQMVSVGNEKLSRLSDTDKNFLITAKKLIDAGQEEDIKNITTKFSVTDIKLLSSYKDLIEYFNNYLENETSEEKKYIGELLDEIFIIKKQIEELEETKKREEFKKEKEVNQTIPNVPKMQNIVLFLKNSDTGNYYIEESQSEILTSPKCNTEYAKSIPPALAKLYNIPFQELKQNENIRTIKGSLYEDEFKPYRIVGGKHFGVRAGYIQMRVSSMLKEAIKETFPLYDSFEVLLVIDAKPKSDDTYDIINGIINRENIEIRRLRELFSGELDQNKLSEINQMIQDGIDISKKLNDNPLEPLISKGKGARKNG